LQLHEARWLRSGQVARDYLRYWFRTPGAEPRRYSTWLADAAWAVHQVHPSEPFLKDLLPDLVTNYEGWEKSHFDKDAVLFWQTGHDDGMEFNINSRQTKDPNRGAPAYRPTLNAYLYADALAIARLAEHKGDRKLAEAFDAKAARLKDNLQKKLWDPKRQFFFPMAKRDETADGFTVRAGSFTHQTGKFAGSPFGRELIGYVPWQFNLPDRGYETAWKGLMDKDVFFAPFGPTTVERKDPLFTVSKRCCWWSGNSWPYATSQTLKAMANLLQNYKQDVVTKDDYLKLLTIYAKTHRKNGRPYIAEACDPDGGSWEGHDSYNHSEHYFHSNYVDLIITGLVGLQPRDDDRLQVKPLAPPTWDYFALEGVRYHEYHLSIYWDRHGTRYGRGKGVHVVARGVADREETVSAAELGPLTLELRGGFRVPRPKVPAVNFAVNNDGLYYPRVSASHTGPNTSVSKLIDGNYWYHVSPPNRWTAEGSPNAADWCAVDFGVPRPVRTVKLYVLDDAATVAAPATIDLEYWTGGAWAAVPGQERTPKDPTGRRANVIGFPELTTQKLRARLTHRDASKSGLSEFEAWGNATLPVEPAPMPAGNLAHNPGDKPFPKVSASHTSRFDKVEHAIDGKVSFHPSPPNRWTSYESPNATDWLEIDFGAPKEFARVELALYDDCGGVRAPERYDIQYWDGKEWRSAANQKREPAIAAGGQFNEVTFDRMTANKVRVVFTHRGKARSGVTEVFVWKE
jgi:F5/8 type C domain